MINTRIIVGILSCITAGILQLLFGTAGAIPAIFIYLLPYVYDIWHNHKYGFIEKVMNDVNITKRDVGELYEKIKLAVSWQKENGYNCVYLAFIQDMEGEPDCVRLLGQTKFGGELFTNLMVKYRPHDMYSVLSDCHATIMNVLGDTVMAIKFSPTTERAFKKMLF